MSSGTRKTQAGRDAAKTSSMPVGILQRRCACGTHVPGGGTCTRCAGTTGLLQRDPATPGPVPLPPVEPLVRDMRPKTDEQMTEDALKKLGEALLGTSVGKKIKDGVVESLFGSTPQAIATGSLAAATIATLAVKHQKLPAQIPAIPLDFLKPGLSVELTWNGPVDRPTDGMVMIKFAPPTATKPRDYAAETQKEALSQARFRESLKFPPGSPEAEREAAFQRAMMARMGGIDIDSIIARYRGLGAQPSAPGNLQLPLPDILQPPKIGSPFGDRFKLRAPEPLRLKDDQAFQRKLSIGATTDPMETEADHVADHVLARSPAHAIGEAPPQIQRVASGVNSETDAVPHSVHRTLGHGGRPLDRGVRQDMERRFGHDFSTVRVHTDDAAAQSTRDVNANAYTVGNNIVFGSGRFSQDTGAGQRLLAHELTHVVQQGAAGSVIRRDPAPPKPLSPSAQILAADLERLIDGAVWKEIRKRAYPKESAPAVKRAKDRRAGKAPEMTGLGTIKSLDGFAAGVRGLQTKWTSLATPDARVKEIANLTTVQMTNANVPKFLVVDKMKSEFKGQFSPATWEFDISEDLVSGAALSTGDAGELANTTLHECRHAEQRFLAARFSAGQNKADAATIEAEVSIPPQIAAAAVARKFDASTDATVAKLGKRMFQATVTDGAKNQKISNDDGIDDMNAMRPVAQAALDALRAGETAATRTKAVAQRDALKAQIKKVEQLYTLYRNIPYESDAHEVGDAAEEAFKVAP